MNVTLLDSKTEAKPSTRDMANALRALAMDSVEKAKSGHPGMPMGMADVAAVLFSKFMKIDPADPAWPDRDRFVLSAGHGSRQGFATAVGMALAERMLHARYGADLVDHFTYVIAGDGCLAEGISHEALDLAGHLQLCRLIVLWDDNQITIDGATDLSTSIDQLARFKAAGWHVEQINGHDEDEITAAIIRARMQAGRPTLIACRTTIGFGAPNRGGTSKAHGEALGAEEIALTRQALNWPHPPFVVPDPILHSWRAIARRGAEVNAQWKKRLAVEPNDEEFKERMARSGAFKAIEALDGFKAEMIATSSRRSGGNHRMLAGGGKVDAPSILALSRQALPTLRLEKGAENLSARGAYLMRDVEEGDRDVTLLASGSEVELAAIRSAAEAASPSQAA